MKYFSLRPSPSALRPSPFFRRGVTLIELLIVIMIIGLLTTAALKAYDTSLQAGRYQNTMRTLNEITYAIVGNPDLVSNGIRIDYGYVGDMGRLPDKLQDLVTVPSGVDPAMWHGPYLIQRVAESPNAYLIDAWGDSLIYNKDSLTISSQRGMSILQPDSWITRKMARSAADLFENRLLGVVYDSKGNATSGSDSVWIFLEYAAPAGHMQTDSQPYGNANNFTIGGQIPVGNHPFRARLTFLDSPAETIVVRKTASIAPGAGDRNWLEVHMPVPFR